MSDVIRIGGVKSGIFDHWIYLKVMKVVILLSLLLALTACDKWAVLVAGSNTYSNYRHQADVFHSYQMLVNNGFDPERIITFAYDDIANSVSNPYKGKVFNKPTYSNPGVDVYEGIKLDYTKADVTPENFLAVLEGNSTATKGKKVLQSGPSDNVFIFFSDHGAVGLIAFPSKYLYANSLIQTFANMKGKYNKVVFYLETCESGSMFQKLPNNTKIYGLSAASPSESSWGTYCSPDDVVQGKHLGSCLGDLFSVNFIEDIDKGNTDQTLQSQFEVVKKLTAQSHVMQWGDLSFQSDSIGDFVTGSTPKGNNLRFIKPIRKHTPIDESAKMNSRTMRLQSLSAIYARTHSSEVFEEMVEEMKSMKRLDSIFQKFSDVLALEGDHEVENINFDCLKNVVESYEEKCGKFSDYGLKFVRNFARACQIFSSEEFILSKIQC